MRIAFLLPSLARTGPIILVQQLIKSLPAYIESEVFYFDELNEVEFSCKGTRISFYKLHDFSGFDLIHTHMLRCDLYYYIHRNRINKPAVSTIHQYIRDNLAYSYNPILARIASSIWEKALAYHNLLVCINKHMSEHYIQKKINSNIICIYNGVEEVEKHPIQISDHELITNLRSKYKILLTIAGLNKTKGIEQIVKFLSGNQDYAYVVIGSGPEYEALKQYADDLEIGERFYLAGFKTNATSYIFYADAYIMPSRSEGFGLSLVEAASTSIPIVCSNIPAFNEMFTKYEVSFFEIDNMDSIKYAVKLALENKEFFMKSSFDKYRKEFTSEQMASRYAQIYQSVMIS